MLSVWVLFLLSWRRARNDTACNHQQEKKEGGGKCKEAEQRGWDEQRIWARIKKEALKRHFCMHISGCVCAIYVVVHHFEGNECLSGRAVLCS